MRNCYLTITFCLALFQNNAYAMQPDASEDFHSYSSVCVEAANSKLQELISVLNKAGISATVDIDRNCGSPEIAQLNLPSGIASWVIDEVRRRKLGRATYGQGTAGGSGIYKSAVDRDFVYSSEIKPDNINDAAKSIECSITSRVNAYFKDVNVKRGCGGSPQTDGLCWTVWLGGHLANSKGLSSNHLENRVSDKYWFSSKSIVILNYVRESKLDVGSLRDAFRIDIMTTSSKFARSPATEAPEPSRYRAVEDSAVGGDGDSIDELIAARLEKIMLLRPFECSRLYSR